MAGQEQSQKEKLIRESHKKIDELLQKLRTPGNLIYDVYNTPSPKKDLILGWAKELERLHELGDYKEPINTISAHIHRELKKMNLESAKFWAWEVLPAKYKNPEYNRIIEEENDLAVVNPAKDSSEKEALRYKCHVSNILYIKRLERTIEVLTRFKKKLMTDTIFVTKLNQKELGEFYTVWDSRIKHCVDILDGREKVMPTTQHFLFATLATETQSFTYSAYVRFIKDFNELTPKQAGKILRGHVSHVHPLWDPQNRAEAIEVGFVGSQCVQCGSWRVEYKYNSDDRVKDFQGFCHACRTWHKIKKQKLLVKAV